MWFCGRDEKSSTQNVCGMFALVKPKQQWFLSSFCSLWNEKKNVRVNIGFVLCAFVFCLNVGHFAEKLFDIFFSEFFLFHFIFYLIEAIFLWEKKFIHYYMRFVELEQLFLFAIWKKMLNIIPYWIDESPKKGKTHTFSFLFWQIFQLIFLADFFGWFFWLILPNGFCFAHIVPARVEVKKLKIVHKNEKSNSRDNLWQCFVCQLCAESDELVIEAEIT